MKKIGADIKIKKVKFNRNATRMTATNYTKLAHDV